MCILVRDTCKKRTHIRLLREFGITEQKEGAFLVGFRSPHKMMTMKTDPLEWKTKLMVGVLKMLESVAAKGNNHQFVKKLKTFFRPSCKFTRLLVL